MAKSEVTEFDLYITGQVYSYHVDEGRDSCGGIFGLEYAIKEAKNAVDYIECCREAGIDA